MAKIITDAAEANGAQYIAALIPAFHGVQTLTSFLPSFYARLENVQSVRQQLKDDERDLHRRYALEEQMLSQVLEWANKREGPDR